MRLITNPITKFMGVVHYKNGHRLEAYNVRDKDVSMFLMDDNIHFYRANKIVAGSPTSFMQELSNSGAPSSDLFIDKIIIN